MKMLKIKSIIIHHTASGQDVPMEKVVNSISNNHRKRLHKKINGFGYNIAYHYIIDSKGEIRPTRPESEAGWHCGNFLVNLSSIAIALTGNLSIKKPTAKQLQTLSEKIHELRVKYNISVDKVKGHRDIKNTECPGHNMTDNIIRESATGVYLVDGNAPSDVHKKSWAWAIKKKITNGDNPKVAATREQVVEMIYRNSNLLTKK